MKLGYKLTKSQNSNEEEKNSVTELANHVSNHGDTNILTRERYKWYLHCAR